MSQDKFTVSSNFIGSRIKAARERKGYAQRTLAEKLKLTRGAPAISEWESGKHVPRGEMIRDIARELDVSVDWLMGENSPETNATPFLEGDAGMPGTQVDNAVNKARRILSSGTSYAEALYVNIIHFDRALDAEERIRELESHQNEQGRDLLDIKDTLAEMSSTVSELKKENAALKKRGKKPKKDTSGKSDSSLMRS